ncbi:hypothetical protein [Neobacillus muris]|uniref:hypothetical protein n=1 Tax=Neobacillus muris TaxID=2941334 RepID=UPI00203FC314|nr:hypothetical protein [Neobacillus muris]
MFGFLAFIGFIGFLVFIVLGIVSIFKKNGKTKKRFGIALILFVLFIIGAVNSGSTDTTETKDEVKEDSAKKQETRKDPSTLAEVQAAITKGMSDQDFKKARNNLEVEQPKSISVGNGNVGYVLQAKDGILVASTDGNTIFDVATFTTMEEVDQYEKDKLAQAEASKKEQAQKEYEASKIQLNGSGDASTDLFKLEKGFAVFEGSHNGSDNFIVKLQNENGSNIDLLVNEIGNYKGKTFAQIPSDGNYYLNINAGGAWNFSISQQPPVDIPKVPSTLQGSGDDVVFFNAESGNYKFSFTHQGEGNFIVKLNGSGLMVNEIGAYTGSMRQRLNTDGYYLLQIAADGPWTVTIEK